MEGMWDEGLRPVWLPLDTRITPSGGKLLTSAQNHQLQPGLGARCPGYPCWVSLWVESLPGCRRKSVLPAVLRFKGAATSPSGASVPTPAECSGQTGVPGRPSCLSCQQKEHWGWSIKLIAISGCCWESDDGYPDRRCSTFMLAVPSQEVSPLAFPALSVMDRCKQ